MNDEATFQQLFGEDEPVPAVSTEEETPVVADVEIPAAEDFPVDPPVEPGQEEEPVVAAGEFSPNTYTSIALALREDGLLTLDEEEVKNTRDASDLATLLQKQVDLLLDERQRRISDALSQGMEPGKVSEYERTLSFLDGITESSLKEETPEAEQLRGNIIFQDFINRGFSKERATKEVKKSLQAGTDVDDAIEALQENKVFFKEKYDTEVNTMKVSREQALKLEKERASRVEKMITETREPIPGVTLTDTDRKKLREQWGSFVSKDPEGRPLTALQDYAAKNPEKYQYNINLLYYLTKGFSDLSPVIKPQVRQKTRTALADIEKTLRTPANQLGLGGIQFGNSREENSRYSVSFNE